MNNYMTYADVFRPDLKKMTYLYDFCLIIGGAILIALCARFVIPLPFTPIPITAQTLAIVLIGALYGSKRAVLSVISYISAGALGIPVFQSGQAGILYLLTSPTTGFLIGFAAAAFLIGLLAEKGWDKRYGTTILAMVLGNIMIYVFGILWFSFFVGIKKALILGFLPFIIGDLFKIIVATVLLPTGWNILKKIKNI